jgi:hypothetical protein
MDNPSFVELLGTFKNNLELFCNTHVVSQTETPGTETADFEKKSDESSKFEHTGTNLANNFTIQSERQVVFFFQNFQINFTAKQKDMQQSEVDEASNITDRLYREACSYAVENLLKPCTDTLCMLESSECNIQKIQGSPKNIVRFFCHFTKKDATMIRIYNDNLHLNVIHNLYVDMQVRKIPRESTHDGLALFYSMLYTTNGKFDVPIYPGITWTPIPFPSSYLQDHMFAFAMGGHRRLGGKSAIFKLPTHVVDAIARHARDMHKDYEPVHTDYLWQFVKQWNLHGEEDDEGGLRALLRYPKLMSYPEIMDTGGSIHSCLRCGKSIPLQL